MVAQSVIDTWEAEANAEPRIDPPSWVLRAFSEHAGRPQVKLKPFESTVKQGRVWNAIKNGYQAFKREEADAAKGMTLPSGLEDYCAVHHIFHMFGEGCSKILTATYNRIIPADGSTFAAAVRVAPPVVLKPYPRGKHPISGNLDRMEFQFWAGVYATNALTAVCRYCRVWVHGRLGRNLHKDMLWETNEKGERVIAILGCHKRLVLAYRILAMKKRCVICEERTQKCIWGVPLCGYDCEKEWMFEQYCDWPALEAVIGPQHERASMRHK